ncbi:hypothetical protein [Angustibacter sp. Root456]|uniref:hypothetical protein n=1 Tax=Angustibacter sp. Root456 TaxID=1736539 RepID=UPI0006FF4E38|nr:hypothetical protein [Angustibacter sp. Root456]KQX64393.1 hypothetical protein ASD06_09420 [Angustibacter sp. Root456]
MDAEEHDRLAERETILAAMLAAAERLHELVDVVQTAPSDDATLLHEVAALLACDEAAARTVLAMPLNAASPARQRRLRGELDEVRQLLT